MTELRSPLQAQVVQWLVAPGDAVRAGDVVVILEAMKMEHEVRSPGSGRVRERLFGEGETVGERQVLLTQPHPGAWDIDRLGVEPYENLKRAIEMTWPAGLAMHKFLSRFRNLNAIGFFKAPAGVNQPEPERNTEQ